METEAARFQTGLGVSGNGECEGPIFELKSIGGEHFGWDPSQPTRIAALAAANLSSLVALQSGDVVRWDQCEDAAVSIEFGKDRCSDISRVFLEPKGFHAIISNTCGDSWYLNFQSNLTKLLPKLRGHQIETISWDPESTATSTRDLLCGTERGQLLHVVVNESKEKLVKPLFAFEIGCERRVPVCGVHRERVVSSADGAERTVVLAAAGCGIYGFLGPTFETVFQRYQGDNAASRALVYEVPRDSPRGELHVDVACVGPAFTKALFWLTGVGALSAIIKNPIEADNVVLESPPGIIPFPPSPKDVATNTGGSVVAALLPPPPPPAPLSMALTKFHVIFLFVDRWAAVSRINHQMVQQQEWARTTHGVPRGLAMDVHGSRLWMYGEKQVFEFVSVEEDRNVWTLLLGMGRFDESLAACKSQSQRDRVLAAHAIWFFDKGMYVDSAKKFAEASNVPFEHVALRFLRVNDKGALLEYLRCRLRQSPAEDKVTRALLGVWAVEFALAHLNDVRQTAHGPKGRAVVDSERARLQDLLKECKDLDIREPLYHLLQSHSELEELAKFAENHKDFNTVIVHYVSRRDCGTAIRKLGDFQAAGAGENLVCRFAPVLFGAEPKAFVSLLLRPEFAKVDPLSVLPAVYLPSAPSGHRAEAIRYLKHVVENHPEFIDSGEAVGEGTSNSGAPSLRTGSLLPDNAFVACSGEDNSYGGPVAPNQGSWASGTAVLNALIVLYACECQDARSKHRPNTPKYGQDEGLVVSITDPEDELVEFLTSQQKIAFLDSNFALRVCSEKGLSRTVILLYSIMGMHGEAVDAALQQRDIALAKKNASKSNDPKVRQKLWLRIVEDQVATGDMGRITSLVRESTELNVRDVLPYLSDSFTISEFQDDICNCLDAYENEIETLRQEMDDHRRALDAFKEDLKEAEERTITVEQDQPCEICNAVAMRERFYAFPCQHCFHEACLRALILPTLCPDVGKKLLTLEAARVQHQAAAAGAMSSVPDTSLAEVEDKVDSILADDCPMCGQLMIDTISRPFIDPGEEAEIDTWAVN